MFPMSSPAVAFFFTFSFLLSAAADAAAFDIGKILSNFSDFSDFSDMLKETGVADDLNNRETVTVLAVTNGNLGALSGQSAEAKKMVMRVHVVLDYYDEAKLNKSHSKTAKILTTLYQQSGMARNQLGFLNMTNTGNGPVVFSSASPNFHLEAQLVKEVTSKPYDISVLQVSNLINIASISPAPSLAPVAAPPPRKVLGPAPGPALASTPSVEEEEDAKSPGTSKTKPSSALPPVADAPASEEEKSAVSVPSGDYLASTVLMVFTCAWLLLTMI
ncbi:FASCICLIN-like arabinogalactan protein 14 precursor [Hibiscus trionum]|uniref:FASCICLIN-like arabinogalactan protein 14 n=1 Tax=Hibiscus trionum TaxID=183268 RepID=A0A9W7I1W0_HIBTR|nr:FASCICLIN-like arabinogalactan protein 14 precursor [Hibiscus trionum]